MQGHVATYIMPIRHDDETAGTELGGYIQRLAGSVEVIVVDGSPPSIFAHHATLWSAPVRHLRPEIVTPNGKVGGVLTGVRAARHERLIIADEDIRYSPDALMRTLKLLDNAAVVRPQNYFDPLPWHACWDTARSLLNRVSGGDWPGTLAVRRSDLLCSGGYDGSVLFENLELVRTIVAGGGRECVPLDLYVRRLPPDARHFWSQRIRQAYDEFARPVRMVVSLALLPLLLTLIGRRQWRALWGSTAATILAAEIGRRRANGRHVFPATASLLAPCWIMERAITAWLALAARFVLGGVKYRGGRLRRAATPRRQLRRRQRAAAEPFNCDVSLEPVA